MTDLPGTAYPPQPWAQGGSGPAAADRIDQGEIAEGEAGVNTAEAGADADVASTDQDVRASQGDVQASERDVRATELEGELADAEMTDLPAIPVSPDDHRYSD